MKTLKYLFGPVPSRRFGRSLGVNVVPSKICSMNCIYCEVGKTKALTIARKPYIKADDIIKEFSENYDNFKNNIDVVTITGAGEPTLNSDLRKILDHIKSVADKPVAILTNSTMLHEKDVFDTLLDFDIVVPSLDAATEESFKKVTLVHDSIPVSSVISSLREFSHKYSGKLFLEILLCEGINDSENEIEALAKAIKDIKCEKIQLGTIARPPAFGYAKAVSDEKLLWAAKYFISKGNPAEVTGGFKDVYKNSSDQKDLKALIIAISKMRPCTIKDFSAVFGAKPHEIEDIVAELMAEKSMVADKFGDVTYYNHTSIDVLKNHHGD